MHVLFSKGLRWGVLYNCLLWILQNLILPASYWWCRLNSWFSFHFFRNVFLLACSGKKGHEVLIQGGVIDDLGRHLVEHYGIPKRYIEVLDKTKK